MGTSLTRGNKPRDPRRLQARRAVGAGCVGSSDPPRSHPVCAQIFAAPRQAGWKAHASYPQCRDTGVSQATLGGLWSDVRPGGGGDCYVSDLAQVDREVTNRNPSLLITPGTSGCPGAPGEARAVLPKREVEEPSRAPWTPQTHPLSMESERGAQGLRPGAGRPQGRVAWTGSGLR